jgi:hypothetical protein
MKLGGLGKNTVCCIKNDRSGLAWFKTDIWKQIYDERI